MDSGRHLKLPESELGQMEADLRLQARMETLKIDIKVKDNGDNTVDISWTVSDGTMPATPTAPVGGSGKREGERVTAAAPHAMAEKIAYQFGKSQLTLEFGDIVTSDAQVIVSSDDCYLSMGGGVSAAIRRASPGSGSCRVRSSIVASGSFLNTFNILCSYVSSYRIVLLGRAKN